MSAYGTSGEIGGAVDECNILVFLIGPEHEDLTIVHVSIDEKGMHMYELCQLVIRSMQLQLKIMNAPQTCIVLEHKLLILHV